jgi:hypothetical protein
MQSTKITTASVLAVAMLMSQPDFAQASYESQCKLERGSLKWDGVGLRWCCWKATAIRLRNHSERRIAWCKS